jgi:hypothetical protein
MTAATRKQLRDAIEKALREPESSVDAVAVAHGVTTASVRAILQTARAAGRIADERAGRLAARRAAARRAAANAARVAAAVKVAARKQLRDAIEKALSTPERTVEAIAMAHDVTAASVRSILQTARAAGRIAKPNKRLDRLTIETARCATKSVSEAPSLKGTAQERRLLEFLRNSATSKP